MTNVRSTALAAIALVAALATSATVNAAQVPTPSATFRLVTSPYAHVEICFKGYKVVEQFEGQAITVALPVELDISHRFTRGKSKDVHRAKAHFEYDLRQYLRKFDFGMFGVEVGSPTSSRPCSTVFVDDPLYGSDRQSQTGQFTLRVSSAGTPLSSATFAYTVAHLGTRRVWEGTDEFVNYCIHEIKDVWSSGGRLYCERELGTRFSVHRVYK